MYLSIIQATAESLFEFAVKNGFYYVALDKVRGQLQDLITSIVRPRLGGFMAPFVGNQLGLMAAMPVTLALGECLAFTLKELIYSVYDLALRFFNPSKRESKTSFFLDTAFQISSFAAGFFAKTLFCNYGMVMVNNLLRVMMFYGAPLCHFPPPVTFALPAVIVLATPTATCMVGDIVGSVVRRIFYNALTFITQTNKEKIQ
jgi:hypothetical protein